jgi:PTS system ascorbate-specific IIA component
MLDCYRENERALDKGDDLGPGLLELLAKERMDLQSPAHDWVAAVECVGDLLIRAGAIERGYVSAMKDLILLHGPYMVSWPGVAILHAEPQAGARKLCMALASFKNPIEFGHAVHDPVYIAFGFCAIDSHLHLNALSQLQSLLETPNTIMNLRDAIHPSQVLHIIEEHTNT